MTKGHLHEEEREAKKKQAEEVRNLKIEHYPDKD